MDIFEYLPQLIVAYDGDDKFANLIHVKKAKKDNNYFCPCCGGIVKPRALDSTKEQSHYYHVTGKCTKESQLHFFCKNWLFEKGSKFYINDNLFEVASIEIEKSYETKFGNYKPDITVHTTSGKTIYFEMFFSNRKTGDDYFCKWNALENDVVEVNIKEYMYKTDEETIPRFTYLYHDGICYSKTYEKRDLYANTIGKIKRELTKQKLLNYKARIEQLDWFWEKIRNNETRECALNAISEMDYEDMTTCYDIIKRKQCISYLKNDVLTIINQKVISDVREKIGLPYDENVYFDLNHVKGRTYEAGIRLKIKTEHITYDKIYSSVNNYISFENIKGFPKIVFSKNILNPKEIEIQEKDIKSLQKIYNYAIDCKKNLLSYEEKISKLEEDKYKIRVKNNYYTVLIKNNNNFEILLENCYINNFDIKSLENEINSKISDNKNKEFLDLLYISEEYKTFLSNLKKYEGINIRVDVSQYIGYYKKGIQFKLYISERKFFESELQPNMDDFIKNTNECELVIQNFMKSYSIMVNLVNKINNCKNDFWKSRLTFSNSGYFVIEVDQKYFVPNKYLTFEKIYFEDIDLLIEEDIMNDLQTAMKKVIKNMERCGYRVMEVIN